MSGRGNTANQRIWVAVLRVSPAVRAKLSSKHGLDAKEVAAALVGVDKLVAAWDDDPERGRRAMVEAWLGARRVLVVLYPTREDGEWNLGSAYPIGQ
ncbi:hypothetical protein [Frankia sp. Cppng1_Ct_nod]|uniref:hypothetical protein n=1 Tax=Frankia sp. Cppng1_Ct_nod TaxID=2897162 RepID=UPI001040F85A|nr:hypothetical protein [Frankia sp. Cppng1_Ct_nod]